MFPEKARLEHLKQAPNSRANLMVYLLARVIGIGIDKADMLAQEILSRNPGRPSSRVCRSKNPDPSQGGRGFFLPACFRRPTNRL